MEGKICRAVIVSVRYTLSGAAVSTRSIGPWVAARLQNDLRRKEVVRRVLFDLVLALFRWKCYEAAFRLHDRTEDSRASL
jgi:hypothetical protein